MVRAAISSLRPIAVPILRLALIVGFAGTLLACGPKRDVKDEVTDRDVLGVWILSIDTIEELREKGFEPQPQFDPYVSFSPHGSCTLLTVEATEGAPRLRMYDGTWKLLHDAAGSDGKKRKNLMEMRLRTGAGEVTRYLWFGKRDGQLMLWEPFGDPKEKEYLDYVRNFIKRS